MIKFIWSKLFGAKKEETKEVTLYPFAVEAKVMLDENTELTGTFIALVNAESKKHAKEMIKNRAFIKVGAAANKTTFDKYKKRIKKNV